MKHVLLVDDDAFIRDLIANKLTSATYEVSVASTLQEGRQAIADNQPDVLLLDIRLPDGNGIELLKDLRENVATRTLPVIVFSNDDSAEVREQTAALHAAFYQKMAVDVEDLRVKIGALVG